MNQLLHVAVRKSSSEDHALVNLMLEDLKTNTTKLVWCNARTTACGFYEKLGFEKSGPEFEIPGIGKHFIMIKVL